MMQSKYWLGAFFVLSLVLGGRSFGEVPHGDRIETRPAAKPKQGKMTCIDKGAAAADKTYYGVHIDGTTAKLMKHFPKTTNNLKRSKELATLTCSEDGGSDTETKCPPKGTINCFPPTTDPNCDSTRKQWIQKNCPGVNFIE